MSMDQPPDPDQTFPPSPPTPPSNVQPVAPPPAIPSPYQPGQPAVSYQPVPSPPPFAYGQQRAYPWRLPKNKTTAVLLAIFIGFTTWMYTYERDAWKFWTAIAIAIVNGILSVVTVGIWLFVAIPVGLGIWIWGIVDTAAKSQQFYDLYPAG